jgi:gamma-glutamyltranspeptidase/glutathione hydrolase
MEAHSREHGGALRASDLAAHAPEWVEPISVDYRGYTVHELPPNGQGLVTLIALAILEHFDLESLPIDSADSLHLQIEATKLGFADALSYLSDPTHMATRPCSLLDPSYVRERARLINPSRAQTFSAGTPPAGGTVYLTTADANGMMVSLIQSNYMGFGSGVVVPETGISLQNRGACFVLSEGHPNRVGPSKRPYHTIIPGFVTRAGTPVMSFGVMGGPIQPQGHVQVMVRIADYRQNPQTAIDAPRFRWMQGLEVNLERGFNSDTQEGLTARGHQIAPLPGSYMDFGSGQAIWKLDHGYFAASDPRRDGQAVGL